MSKKNIVYSAGILLYKIVNDEIYVFLAHPGGPYWENTDEHSWGIPKGRLDKDEPPIAAAYREFKEEIGCHAPHHEIKFLGEFGHARRIEKRIYAYYDFAPHFKVKNLVSNLFELEWPENSGNIQLFPEIDKAKWLKISRAYKKIMPGQVQLLQALENKLGKTNATD